MATEVLFWDSPHCTAELNPLSFECFLLAYDLIFHFAGEHTEIIFKEEIAER